MSEEEEVFDEAVGSETDEKEEAKGKPRKIVHRNSTDDEEEELVFHSGIKREWIRFKEENEWLENRHNDDMIRLEQLRLKVRELEGRPRKCRSYEYQFSNVPEKQLLWFLREQMNQQELTISRLLSDRNEHEKLLDELEEIHEADLISFGAQIARLESKVYKLTRTCCSLESSNSELTKENRILKAKNPAIFDTLFSGQENTGLQPIIEELEALKAENKSLLAQLDEQKSTFEARTNQFVSIRNRLKSQIKGLQAGTEVDPSSLTSVNNTLSEEVETAAIESARRLLQIQDLQKSVQNYQKDLRQLLYENARLKAEIGQTENIGLLRNPGIQSDEDLLLYIREERMLRLEQISNLESRVLEQKMAEESLISVIEEERRQNENTVDRLQRSLRVLQQMGGDTGNGTLSPPPKRMTEMMRVYLKRVLLQFFLQDASKRAPLIPVILNLVGCNEKQISTVQRVWLKRNNV
jgi:hypothetical protein